LIILAAAAFAAGLDAPAPKTMDSLPPTVRSLTETALQYMDSHWDEEGGLVGDRGGHGTRASAQYAV